MKDTLRNLTGGLAVALGAAVVCLVPGVLAAQEADEEARGCWIRGDPADLELRISPLDSASVEVAGREAEVCYSRPRALGRPIMGRLVPYGEPWRLGANEATSIVLPFPASFGGEEVDPGRYSIYAVPGRDRWRVVLNADWRRWGVPVDSAVRAADVATIEVEPERTERHVEDFTIGLESVAPDSLVLTAAWERTRIRVPFRVELPDEP